jgi:hypothetical protein
MSPLFIRLRCSLDRAPQTVRFTRTPKKSWHPRPRRSAHYEASASFDAAAVQCCPAVLRCCTALLHCTAALHCCTALLHCTAALHCTIALRCTIALHCAALPRPAGGPESSYNAQRDGGAVAQPARARGSTGVGREARTKTKRTTTPPAILATDTLLPVPVITPSFLSVEPSLSRWQRVRWLSGGRHATRLGAPVPGVASQDAAWARTHKFSVPPIPVCIWSRARFCSCTSSFSCTVICKRARRVRCD